jgi:Mrp family chromosome partitioning ATPase
VLGLADAQLLSAAASATVFVAGSGQSRIGVVRGAIKRLQTARGTVIGAVLTKHDAKATGYGYGYGHEYGYGYGYGQATEAAPRGLSIARLSKREPELQLTDEQGRG